MLNQPNENFTAGQLTHPPISLLTGGAGFLGAHLSRQLIAMGHKVVILDDLSGGFRENLPQGATFVQGSITDKALLQELFQKHKFDYVYHLAAYAAEGLSHFIRHFNYENNLIGSINLINESVKNKIKCFVFTSSIAVYGKNQVPMHEDMTPLPEDPYGIAKYAVELDLKAAHEMFGLNHIIFRPHNVYGEFQNLADKYRNVVGIFMNNLMKGAPLGIFGDGLQTRAFSYAGDIAPVIANSINFPNALNKSFNIGADKEYTVLELAEAVSEAMEIEGKIELLKARKEVIHAYADHALCRKHFGEHSHTDLKTGLKKMAQWAKSCGISNPVNFSQIEITENLPLAWKQ